MGLLLKLLGAPVDGPVRGFAWVAATLADRVDRELYDPSKLRRELEDLQLRYDLGEIGEEELERGEAAVLERLASIREREATD